MDGEVRSDLDKNTWALIAVFSLTYLAAKLSDHGTLLRWPIYGIPAASFLIWIASSRRINLAFDRRFLIAALIYAFICLLSLSSGNEITFQFIRDFLILFGVLFTFVPYFNVNEKHIRFILLVLIITFILNILYSDNNFLLSFDFIDSHGGFESTVAFPAGILALYFFHRKSWFWMSLALIAALLGFKRIVILAFFIGAGFSIFVSHRSSLSARSKPLWHEELILLVAMIGITIGAVLISQLMDYMFLILDISMSADQFAKGRLHLNQSFLHELGRIDAINLYFGNGAGSSDRFTFLVTRVLRNPHNDYIKLIFDYGIIGSSVFIIMIYSLYRRHRLGLPILLFNLILMITDNITIYFFHQFISYMVLRATENTSLGDSAPSPATHHMSR